MKQFKKSQFNPTIILADSRLITIFSPYTLKVGSIVTFNNRTINGIVIIVEEDNVYTVDIRTNIPVTDCQYKDILIPKVLTTKRLIGLAEFPESLEDLVLDIPLIVREPHEAGTLYWELYKEERLIVKGTDYATPRRIFYTEKKRAFKAGKYSLEIKLKTSIGLITIRSKEINWDILTPTNKLEYKSLIKLELL